MCADIHDGREQNAPFKGRIQMRETNYLQISHIRLATHGKATSHDHDDNPEGEPRMPE
jgi:hypothetical protein